jgi:hypothetical protein
MTPAPHRLLLVHIESQANTNQRWLSLELINNILSMGVLLLGQ